MMRRMGALDMILLLCVGVLAASTLVPAIARIQRTPMEAKCQSNMRRWAEAMALYCADYQGRYPTNRPWLSTGPGLVLPSVLLSSPVPIPPATEPPRFQYSINWVEALYTYLQSAGEKTGQDWNSFKKCPAASSNTIPTIKGPFYLVTYVFNRNLVEYWEQLVRRPQDLMMIREMGRLTIATLRPSNDSRENQGVRPTDSFMIAKDADIPQFDPNEYLLHGNGSYVMFADGHVRWFDISYFATDPPTCRYQAAAWDSTTLQWYNYYYANPTTPEQEAKNKSIAISP